MMILVCIEVPSSVVYLASLGDAVTPLRDESSVAVDLRCSTIRHGKNPVALNFLENTVNAEFLRQIEGVRIFSRYPDRY